MRRRLNGGLRDSAQLVPSLAREWNEFWYTPADPTLLGAIRIMTVLMLYLTIGGSGQALSADRWLATRRRGLGASRPAPSMAANLAIRLINIHMCVIYFSAGISKLKGDSWWDGTAMWRAFANLEYQ